MSTTVSFVFLGLLRIWKETELMLKGQMIEPGKRATSEQCYFPLGLQISFNATATCLCPRYQQGCELLLFWGCDAAIKDTATQTASLQRRIKPPPACRRGRCLGLWMMSVIPWLFFFITLMRWNLSWGQSGLLSQTFTMSIMAHGGHICN